MRILALNPYHAGSHQAFLDGWIEHSYHDFETLTLPGHHWKWRMRHAGATLAAEANVLRQGTTDRFDAIWCTSMLDLASFYGLCDEWFRSLPAMVYFHENQLTYPTRHDDPRDHHFAITHLTSALAAIQRASSPGHRGTIAWNSAYHRDAFLTAASKMLQKMPGREFDHLPDMIRNASVVLPPGIQLAEPPETIQTKTGASDNPLHILWVGRWEHDKDPDAFFAAMKKLKKRGCRFKLSVLGESFSQVPDCFATAKKRFAEEVVRWGYQVSRADYETALRDADVVVSTARHEFFGVAIVEAVAADCFPVLPHRLAYPEVFGEDKRFYYDGTPDGLADHLMRLNTQNLPTVDNAVVQRYRWETAAEQLDAAIQMQTE